MKRYFAFAGEDEPRVADFLGDHDDLTMAKHAVQVREPDGIPVHLTGLVLDTQTRRIVRWRSDGRPFGEDRWSNDGLLPDGT